MSAQQALGCRRGWVLIFPPVLLGQVWNTAQCHWPGLLLHCTDSRSADCSVHFTANGMRDCALMIKKKKKYSFSKRNEGGTTVPGVSAHKEMMNYIWVCISVTKNLKWYLPILFVLHDLFPAPMTIQNIRSTSILRFSFLFRKWCQLNGDVQKEQPKKNLNTTSFLATGS